MDAIEALIDRLIDEAIAGNADAVEKTRAELMAAICSPASTAGEKSCAVFDLMEHVGPIG